jgi:Tfp pilus assembly protein PilV
MRRSPMKRQRKSERGMSLIESMAALGIMMIGALGMASLHTTGVRMNGDARRMTRASAIAQDLLNNMELWPYQGPDDAGPLQNTDTDNDAEIGDPGQVFETAAAPPADHSEADLPAGFPGISSAALGGEYQRFWNVSYPTDPTNDSNANGVADAVRIAVIVRWQHGAGWRRIVLVATKRNPEEL